MARTMPGAGPVVQRMFYQRPGDAWRRWAALRWERGPGGLVLGRRRRSALGAEQAARAVEQDGGHEQVDDHGADRAADARGHGRAQEQPEQVGQEDAPEGVGDAA